MFRDLRLEPSASAYLTVAPARRGSVSTEIAAKAPHPAARPRSASVSAKPRVLAAVAPNQATNLPVDAFSSALHAYIQDRRGYDNLAAADQVTNKYYSNKRRDELRSLPGGHYASVRYGLKVIKINEQADERSGLRFEHELSSVYHRERIGLNDAVYDKKHQGWYDGYVTACASQGRNPHPAKLTYFLNSKNALQRFHAVRKSRQSIKTDIHEHSSHEEIENEYRVLQVDPHLVAIEFDNTRDPLLHESYMPSSVINAVGAMPSLYSRNTFIHGGTKYAATPQSENGRSELQQLDRESKDFLVRLKQISKNHALKTSACIAHAVVDGLKHIQLHEADGTVNPVVRSSLRVINKALRALPTLIEDTQRFTSCYEHILEETHVILMSMHPYALGDYKAAALKSMHTRLGIEPQSLDHLSELETYLVSSGMDALSEGIKIAQQLSGQSEVRFLSKTVSDDSPDYYEIRDVRSALSKRSDTPGRAVLSILNSSGGYVPSHQSEPKQWDVQTLSSELERHSLKHDHAPLVAVIDTTVQRFSQNGKSDIAFLYKQFEPAIASGQLKLILCKSYQKYTSLGSGKIMAGAISLIAKDDTATQLAKTTLQNIEADLHWAKTEDAQLLTHFLKYAEPGENLLVNQAANSAHFMHAMFLKNHTRFQYDSGVPLLFVKNIAEPVRTQDGLLDATLFEYLNHDIPEVSSFGFLHSSALEFVNKARISVGQEPRAELIEKLYGTQWLVKRGQRPISVGEIRDEIHHVLASGCAAATLSADVTKWADVAIGVVSKQLRLQPDRKERLAALEHLLVTALDKEDIKASQEASLLLKNQLRDYLYAAPTQTSGRKNTIGDYLRIIKKAFAPVVPDHVRQGTDVHAMRHLGQSDHEGFAEQRRSMNDDQMRQYVQARYAPNMAVSLVGLIHAGLDEEAMLEMRNAGELKNIKSLYTNMLDSGLMSISPAYRNRLVGNAFAFFRETGGMKHYAAAAVAYGRLLPHQEDRALLYCDLWQHHFSPGMERRLKETLYDPLDTSIKAAVAKRLYWPTTV